MKRPEGFDRGATPPAPPPRVRPNRGSSGAAPAPQRPAPATASRPASTGTGFPQPARPRSARAEFAAAERRRRREERAEVRRFTRGARRRRIGWISAASVLVTLLALVAAAVFSPILALRHVVVDGTSRLDAGQLAAAVEGQLGTPLALLDEGRIRRELAQFTLIRSYVTELVPPDTMVIHIVERSPIGVVASADGFQLVDPAGVAIETTPTAPEGYPEMRLAAGDDVHGAGFRAMAEVLLALPSNVLGQVSTISAQTTDDVTLTLAGSKQRVVWGSAADSEAKAATLASLLKLHKRDGAGEYDVSAPGIGVFHKD
jgi:cell division protein FtsQ